MARNFISEDDIEQALLNKLHSQFGFELLKCYTAQPEVLNDGSNRRDKRDVILADRLKTACLRLNPVIPESVFDGVVEQVMDRRAAMSAIAANRELYGLIRDGVPVTFEDEQGVKQNEYVKLIDFDEFNSIVTPAQAGVYGSDSLDSRLCGNDASDSGNNGGNRVNEYLAVSQLWIKAMGQAPKAAYRRPDVILYINGLPLVFVELKNSNVKLRSAYDGNLSDYKNDIPQLFHANAFCILSNANETKVGSFTADWGHFFNWLHVDNEKEKVDRKKIANEGTSLEYAAAGLCQPAKLLDYVENFILFHKENTKIIAQNHQFIGVNNAYARFQRRHELDGKLGIFWHTQGSGKSFSMIFYARKIFRKVTGNFSFVVVTDRQDLDGQIYRNFLNTGTIHEKDAAQPKDSEQLRKFLGQNKKVVFTLIHKFRYAKGKKYPHLLQDDGREVIVMVDEAHRTQYKDLAENMRAGLKGANFIAFTGTPLLGKRGKEGQSRKPGKTESWFGGYVSEYNFQQAMDDGATVPLYYEKRVPEVLIQNEDLGEEFYQLLEDESLDEAQEEKLEKHFAKELEVIKRDDRLETIAKDIVYHFPRRGYLGKGLFIAVDKFTTVKMYDKVQAHWKAEIKRLTGLKGKANEVEKARYKKLIAYMKSVEMAVVISDPHTDEKKFEAAGLDIKPHTKRLEQLDKHGHDIEYNFKDPEHPLQLVFVCAMWLTGFDAPTVSTLYIDKPMKDHTLMQTIARANRVTPYVVNGVTKENGEIVDYYNVFRNMRKALKDYALGEDDDQQPVERKDQLFILLDDAIEQARLFCLERDINLNAVMAQNDVFGNISLFNQYSDVLLSNDDWRKNFNVYENTVSSLYEACKPESFKQPPRPLIPIIQYLRGVVETHVHQADIDSVTEKIAELLDESVVVNNSEKFVGNDHKASYEIIQRGRTWDLSKIDFEKLREDFKRATYKNIEIADMRAFIEEKLRQMIEANHTRTDFQQKFQEIIDRYNSGASSTDNYHEQMLTYIKGIKDEDERHVRKGLTEDELEIYDTLKKDKLSVSEEQKIKLAAKHLIKRLLEGHPKVLVQEWWKDGQTLRQVKNAVEEVLDHDLPDSYDRITFKEKCDNVIELIVNLAANNKKWVA
ncbi:MAG: type I restriction endonuclease subunit R [Candidatus Thiodiazotropha endolucinida]